MKFLSFSFSFSIPSLNMFPIAFTQTFEFISPTSILEPAITPTFKQFYPPLILTKHPIWYSIDADFFIALRGTLYGLHWWYFQNLPLFQGISHPWRKTINWTSSPTSYTIQYSEKQPLWSLPYSSILWHCQTQPFNKGWLDQFKMTVHGLIFPRSNSYHRPKVLWPSTLAITTNATNVCLIYPNWTDNQTTKLGRGMMTKGSFNTGWGLWRRRNLCWGRLNLDRGYCYIFRYTILLLHFFPLTIT